jgi:hypothetical protein
MTTKTKPRQTLAELRSLQRLAGAVIMNPLNRNWRMQSRWIDQRDMHKVTEEFIKPNDRLTSFERIEIYNRQYWYRLIDNLYEDFPGLLSILGQKKFSKLVRAYLAEYPSRSYTLRNLGSRMVEFIQKHPRSVAPRFNLAIDMVRFEWAQMQAFDGPSHPPLSVDDLLGKDPKKLRLGVQPYLNILSLRYPLDDYVLQLKKVGLRGEASNAMEERAENSKRRRRKVPIPRPKPVFVIVHRHENSLYYKRISAAAYQLLCALRKGATLHKALSRSLKTAEDAALAKRWFETWSSLGWFCKPGNHPPLKANG